MRSAILFVIVVLCETAAAQPGADPSPQPYSSPPQPDPYGQPQPYDQPQPQPYPQQPQPQQGSRATFVSTAEKRWDVRIDNNAICTTPCSMFIEPLRFVTLHSHDPRPTKLSVGYLPGGDVLVNAKPRSDGAFATGVTFTSLGGAAAITGITLTAVGCSTDRSGMCRAGIITGVAGLAVTAGSISLIKRSLPSVQVGPANGTPYVTGTEVGLAGSF